MLSIVFGTAFEDETIPADANVRFYRADGRRFVGHETEEISHACDTACVQTVLAESGGPWTETEDGGAYVALESGRDAPIYYGPSSSITVFDTADVMAFDAGDDPYVLCAACQTELLRDDDRYREMFGTEIGGNR